jgi:Trp operon repressor
MKRYQFLSEDGVYTALNKLRAAFLAAKDGNEVDDIIMGLLTHDERMKIGRRIQIAGLIKAGMPIREIKKELKVGLPSIMLVENKLNTKPRCFDLIGLREYKVEKAYKNKRIEKEGSPKLIRKKTIFTDFKRKDVKR